MSVEFKGQLLWVPGRSALRQSYSARRLQPLRLACYASLLPQSPRSPLEPLPLKLPGSVLCLMAGLICKLKASCWSLCCIINEAGRHQHQLRCTFCHRKAVRH